MVSAVPAAAGITDNLIGHWKLDETDPANFEVLNSAPVAAPEHGVRTETMRIGEAAPVGMAYFFNGQGNDDFVALGTSFVDGLRTTNELTISGWINLDFLRAGTGAGSRQTIVGADSHLQFSLQNEGQFTYVYRRDGAFVTITFTNHPPVSAGEFMHVALVHERDPDGFGDDRIAVYVNGELMEERFSFPSIPLFEIGGDVLHLGRYAGNTSRDFDGRMSAWVCGPGGC